MAEEVRGKQSGFRWHPTLCTWGVGGEFDGTCHLVIVVMMRTIGYMYNVGKKELET
jgi:hypothetical protein